MLRYYCSVANSDLHVLSVLLLLLLRRKGSAAGFMQKCGLMINTLQELSVSFDLIQNFALISTRD